MATTDFFANSKVILFLMIKELREIAKIYDFWVTLVGDTITESVTYQILVMDVEGIDNVERNGSNGSDNGQVRKSSW
jgi:hypothetical protein